MRNFWGMLWAAFCVLSLGACSATSFDALGISSMAMADSGATQHKNQGDVQEQTIALANPLLAADTGVEELGYAEAKKVQNLANRGAIELLITKYAAQYNLPARLVHRVVNRESTYNPNARNGVHLGLMQINPQTARTMGYRGPSSGLLDAETNLKYGVKYLAGAYLVAQGNEDKADRYYQSGYYYTAKRMGLLKETGLRP